MGGPPRKHKAPTRSKAHPGSDARYGPMIYTKAGAPEQAGLMIHTKAGAPEPNLTVMGPPPLVDKMCLHRARHRQEQRSEAQPGRIAAICCQGAALLGRFVQRWGPESDPRYGQMIYAQKRGTQRSVTPRGAPKETMIGRPVNGGRRAISRNSCAKALAQIHGGTPLGSTKLTQTLRQNTGQQQRHPTQKRKHQTEERHRPAK